MTDTTGAADVPQTLVSRLRELAADRPDDVLLVVVGGEGDTSLTAAELDRRSSQLAGAMADKGVGIGDRVSCALRNSPELVLATFAAWKLGATPIPVRWDLPEWEVDQLCGVIDARLQLRSDDLDWIRATALDDVPVFDDVLAPRMMGICSSGSSGTPKIIVNGLPAIYSEVFSTPMMQQWRPVPRPQVVLVPGPMYHVNAFVSLHNLLAGDRIVVLERFDAARMVDAVERHRVTCFTATPTMLQRIADLPGIDERDLSSIDWVLQGAAPMPASLVHRWVDLVGAERLLMAYGMTEAIGITALRGDEWMAHPGSVGRGLRGTEVRILDPAGNPLPPGEIGEIYMRSPSYGGSDYLGDAPRPATTEDGFQTVGDLGHLDDQGYLYIADRRVDVIITGGANVFPAQVENALIDHPGIADVVVVGLSDPEWGRRVHAIVQPADPPHAPSAEDVIAYAKGRLAAYKVPKTVEFVDSIPRSEATKVNRGRLVQERGG